MMEKCEEYINLRDFLLQLMNDPKVECKHRENAKQLFDRIKQDDLLVFDVAEVADEIMRNNSENMDMMEQCKNFFKEPASLVFNMIRHFNFIEQEYGGPKDE